jgi:hypothetical protein
VDGDPVAGLPAGSRRTGAQHDAGRVGADDVVRQVVPLAEVDSRPNRSRNPKVDSGSKIEVHTVL